jgi:hypothetical protein
MNKMSTMTMGVCPGIVVSISDGHIIHTGIAPQRTSIKRKRSGSCRYMGLPIVPSSVVILFKKLNLLLPYGTGRVRHRV